MRVLGPFAVRRGGSEVAPGAFGGRQAQTLLRVLAVRHGTLVTRDALAAVLWPHRAPADPAASLNVLASRVRRATGASWLVTARDGGYLLPADDRCQVDGHRFIAEVAAAQRMLAGGSPHEALAMYEEALGRWAGEPLVEDSYAEWAQPFRRELFRVHSAGLEGASQAALACGDPSLALQHAERAVAADPLREPANLLVVRALAADGDTAGAAAAYTDFRDRLADETGLDPSPEAEQLLRRLLLREPPGPMATVTEPDRQRGKRSGLTVGELPFVGRRPQLDAALAAATGREPGVAVVVAASGAGKSRLLDEAARAAGLLVVRARAFLAEREDSWSMARSLLHDALAAGQPPVDLPPRLAAALVDVLPEMGADRALPDLATDRESRRQLTMEAALRVLGDALASGGLLVADDLQWADATSLRLLARLRWRAPQAGMILAYRPEDVRAHSRQQALLDDLQQAGRVTRIDLEPLSPDAIAELFADSAVADAVARHTDRSPIAVAEVVGALARAGAVRREREGRWSATGDDVVGLAEDAARSGQRLVVRRRADAQPRTSQEVLHVLALLAREVPAGIVAASLETPEHEILQRLDALARAGLVRLGDQGWATGHDLVTETVVEGLSPATRLRLHGALADALSAAGAEAAELARHHAGAGEMGAAAATYVRAAQDALDRFANAESVHLATAGLSLDPPRAERVDLLEVRAEAHARSGAVAEARADLREALTWRPAGPTRARLLARHARLAAGTDDLSHAAELVELALTESGEDAAARAAALYAGAIVDMNIDRPERAEQRTEEALALFESLGDGRGIADVLDARAMATFLEGDLAEALALFDRVARLFTDVGALMRVVTPRSTRGHGLVFAGRAADGLDDVEEALDIARSLGHQEGEAYALWHRGEVLAALGRGEEALVDAQGAVEIAARLGHRAWMATSHRALGIAYHALGDLDRAEAAFRRSLELAAHWPLMRSWACARIALVRLAGGHIHAVEDLIVRALGAGPPLAHHEARLAHAELTAARGDDDAASVAATALRLARLSGHIVTVPRLVELAGDPLPLP